MRTLVFQSKGPFMGSAWLDKAMHSVAHWAQRIPADYRVYGDEMFTMLPLDVRNTWQTQTHLLIDVARLVMMQRALSDEGYERVVWVDADVLIFNPEKLKLPFEGHLIGRQVWSSASDKGSMKVSTQAHNAYLVACRGDSFLGFYLDTVIRLLRSCTPPTTSALVGESLLSSLQPVAKLSVEERVGSLSPLALNDVAAGGGDYLGKTIMGHAEELCAMNMGHSRVGQTVDGVSLDDTLLEKAVDRMLAVKDLRRLLGE